jgi:hypothetical protein
MAGIACCHPLGDAVGMSGVLTEHSVGPGGRRLRSFLVRKSFPLLELLGWPSVPHLWGWQGGGGRIEVSTRCSRELFACCKVGVPRMLFSHWYTSPTVDVSKP